MTEVKARWTIPLAGTCDVCQQPALRMSVYDAYRLIVHTSPLARPCAIPNPTRPVDGPTGHNRHLHATEA